MLPVFVKNYSNHYAKMNFQLTLYLTFIIVAVVCHCKQEIFYKTRGFLFLFHSNMPYSHRAIPDHTVALQPKPISILRQTGGYMLVISLTLKIPCISEVVLLHCSDPHVENGKMEKRKRRKRTKTNRATTNSQISEQSHSTRNNAQSSKTEICSPMYFRLLKHYQQRLHVACLLHSLMRAVSQQLIFVLMPLLLVL